jgi:hypothetical protein
MIITLLNPPTTDLEKTYLTDPIAKGVTTLPVRNNDRFVANDRILIGEMGQENSEVVTYSASPDNTSITVSATLYPHSADDPVYRLRYDQAKFYRSITGINGTYTILSTQNLDVDNANQTTIYDDISGLSTYYYKLSVYHSVLSQESSLSDPIPGSGFSRKQVGNIIDEVLKEVSDVGESHMTRSEILGYFNDVGDFLLTNAPKPYNFLRTNTLVNRVAGENYIDFPVDSDGNQSMWKFDRLDYRWQDTTTTPDTDNSYTLEVFPEEEFRNTFQQNTFDSTNESDYLSDISIDWTDQRILLNTAALTSGTSTFKLYYWKFFDLIDSEGDTIETPTPLIYKLYIKMMYYTKRSASDPNYKRLADSFERQYNSEVFKYKGVDRPDAGTPRSFRPPNSVTKSLQEITLARPQSGTYSQLDISGGVQAGVSHLLRKRNEVAEAHRTLTYNDRHWFGNSTAWATRK